MTDRVYRAVITTAPDGAVPALAQIPDWDNGDGRWTGDDMVAVPYRGGTLTFVPVLLMNDYRPFGPEDDDERFARRFRAGQSRRFLSRKAADHKAAVWMAHGCSVRVDVSEPILWPDRCEFCLEPLADHSESEAASCRADIEVAP